MGFMDILRILVIIVVICILILVGQIFTFNHLEVFLKGLPPTQVTHAIMRVVFSILKSLFHYFLIFVIIMYIIYKILKVLYFLDFPIPFRTILLSTTPLYELQVSGIFDLIDAILGIFGSGDTLVNKFIRLVKALGRFLASPYYLLQGSATGFVIEVGGGPAQKKQEPKPAEKGEFNTEDNTEGEALYDENIPPNENRFVQKEYQQCLSENYIVKTDDMDETEKLTVDVKNNSAKIICDVKKLQSYSTLISTKF